MIPDLLENGEPVTPCMVIQRIPYELGNSKVRHSKWASEPKPYTVFPNKANRMHSSIEMHYFYHLGKTIPEGNLINLGVGKGASVAAFAYGFKEVNKRFSQIFGIDLFNHVPNCDKPELEKLYAEYQLDRFVTLFKGYTHEFSKLYDYKAQLLLIDADHHYETCKMDFHMWSPHVVKNGLLLFHDVDYNTVNRVIEEEVDTSKWEFVEQIYKIKTFRRK